MFLPNERSPFQKNGAPRGFGQQDGNSIYLDNPRNRDQRVREGGAVQGQIEQPTDPDQQIINAQQALMRQEGAGPTQAQQQPPPAQAAPQQPWQKGQIVGGARQGADFARLGGGFGNADTDSLKHTFGRIAQNFEHNDAGLQALVQDEEFRRLFPKATLNKDWIDFGGQYDPHSGTNVGKIDVLHAWDPNNGAGNNKNWQWLTEEDALAGSQPQGGMQMPFGTDPNDPIYQALMGGQDEQTGLDQLLMQLMQGQEVR